MRLLEACRPPVKLPAMEEEEAVRKKQVEDKSTQLDFKNIINDSATSQTITTLSRRLRVRDDGTGKGRETDGTFAEFENRGRDNSPW